MNGQVLIVGYFLLLIVCALGGAILGRSFGAGRANPKQFMLGGLFLGAFVLFPLVLLLLGF